MAEGYTDANDRVDEMVVSVNDFVVEGQEVHGEVVELEPLPPRPAEKASLAKWREYVEALGVHPEHSEAPLVADEEGAQMVAGDTYSRAELIELADRLGG